MPVARSFGARQLIAFAFITLGAVSLLVAGGWAITARFCPTWGTDVLLVAGGINLIAGWTSFIPLMLVRRRHVDYVPQAAMAGTALRVLLAAGALLVALQWGPWDGGALSVWMVAMYMPLLAIESLLAIRLVRRIDRASTEVAA